MDETSFLPNGELLAERLQALAHPVRLALWRQLIAHGQQGVAAGLLAETLGLAPNALTFHLDRLRHVGLITVRRQGRQRIYCASLVAMQRLLTELGETCCQALPETCGNSCPGAAKARVPRVTVQPTGTDDGPAPIE